MAYSYVQYVGNGSTVTFSVPFAYISKEHIEVRVNSVLKTVGIDYTWVSASAITFVTAPGSGLTVDIRRRSSPAARLVDFQDGSTLTQDILDADSNQNFFLAQESYDSADISLHKDTDGQWNAEGRRLKNVGTPVEATDALTKGTLDAVYPAVNTVATNLDNVQKVAADLSSNFGYQTDLGSISDPVSVPPSQTSRIQTVAENITDVQTVADNITSVQNAVSNAASAQASATAAASSATTASTKASEASTSAYNAEVSATAAANSAGQSLTYSTNSANSATSSAASATLANDWATKTSGTVAGGEFSAKYHAQNAASSATTATNNASAAATSATNAQSSAASASASAASATSSASSASSSASSASTSASNAATSATNAANSATAAATSATNAASSATAAASSASSASSSATSATSSASTATTQAGIATSAANAAGAAQVAAETARDQTLAAYDNFDDRYLGTKSSDPTVDNDGNALVGGALYFSSTDGVMKVYTGSTWVAAYASLSGALLVANNLSDLSNTTTARSNLGLGSLAVLSSVGTANLTDASVTAAKLASTLDLGSI